jgi:DNA-binding transcriptional ArsR family regulator
MDAPQALAALADPTRRAIFDRLVRSGPAAVGVIAAALPVSRPAVSQHLRVLADAGLVTVATAGTRHLYAADPSGLAALQAWVEARWASALDRFAEDVTRRTTMDAPPIAPIVKTRTVPCDAVTAFALFTDRIADWWPVATHSIAGDAVRDIRVEGRVGGRVVEVVADGTEHSWADVLAWDPPHRFVLSWHPNPAPIAASRLEVRFRAVAGGTEVTLEHSGWEEFGTDGPALRDGYETGWDVVLEPFERAAA